MNNIKSKLSEQKDNGIALTILILLSVLFLGINFYQIYEVSNGSNLVPNLFFGLTIPLTYVMVALWYEKNKLSFAAHLVFFVGFLERYLRQFYQAIFSSGTSNELLILFIGTLATIYIIFKLITHNNEIRANLPLISRPILVLIIISLINTYIISNFSTMLVFGFLMVIGMATSNAKGSLPIVMLIYISRIFETLKEAYIISQNFGLTQSQKTSIVINIIFALLIVFYTVRMLTEDRYYRS